MLVSLFRNTIQIGLWIFFIIWIVIDRIKVTMVSNGIIPAVMDGILVIMGFW